MSVENKYGKVACQIKAEGNKLRIFAGFVIDGTPSNVSVTVSENGLLSNNKSITNTNQQTVRRINNKKFYKCPQNVDADIGQKSFDELFILYPQNKNKFRKDVENIKNKNNRFIPRIVDKYPDITVKVEGEAINNIRTRNVNDPHFYPTGSAEIRTLSQPRNGVVLANELVLISENSVLDVCDHNNSDKLKKKEFSEDTTAGVDDKIVVKDSKSSTEYEYIEYCDKCNKIVRFI